MTNGSFLPTGDEAKMLLSRMSAFGRERESLALLKHDPE